MNDTLHMPTRRSPAHQRADKQMHTNISNRTRLKTPGEAKQEFLQRGQSVAEWSRANKVRPQMVCEILNGNTKRKCLRGQSHKIAVLLGIKEGVIDAVAGRAS